MLSKSQRLLGFYSALSILVLATASSSALAAQSTAPAVRDSGAPLYKQVSARIEDRVEDLLSRMTLEEKVAQLLAVWDSKADLFRPDGKIDPARLSARFPHGLGQYTRPSDVKGPGSPRQTPRLDARDTVEAVQALQHWATTQTRLGIPLLMHEETLHGYATNGATSFPQAISMASSWDPDLVREVNRVIARETRARGVHLGLSPVVDIARDPRWGRIEETFGEDPFLVGEMGVASVEGLQGAKAERLAPGRVFATLKHLTGHGQPESGTNIGPAPVSERELRENFFPPFEQVVRRTGISAVMASYNEIDGVPSHANRWLLHDVLRGEWGYGGAVVSDYYAIEQLSDLHRVARDHKQAALSAINAGVDSDLPEGRSYRTLADAVRSGELEEAKIDAAVRQMLRLKFRAGLFENPFGDARLAEQITNNDEARALARRAAQRSVILLKNDGTLPLDLSPGKKPRIAVIGPNAGVARLGGYYGDPPTRISLLEGVRARAADRAEIVYAEGVKITLDDDWWEDKVELASPSENWKLVAQAVEVARSADQIVLAIGDTEQTSREAWADNHLGDRSSLDLVGEQQELFDALKALGKPITVVLINGRPASTVKIADEANAILEAWYLGEQGGHALADILFGDVNPGGKLPVTIPRDVGQLPLFYNYKPSAHRGYLFSSAEPLYPFGYGLSYTSFDIGAPLLSTSTIRPDGKVEVVVPVRNMGDRAGDETIQVYVRDKVSSVTRPVKELKAFRRITLATGENAQVRFILDRQAFQMWNARMERVVEPGEFEIMVGPNSRDLKSVTLTVEG